GNDWLYAMPGLAATMAALRANGVLAIWSAHADRKFTARLRQAGFEVDEVPVRAHANKGARHLIWIARKADRKSSAKAAAKSALKPSLPRRRGVSRRE
ncbi:MAG TPA: hypothetical protein VFN25_04055, partial [Dokdonella sp.]|nr:hypothetical protein [Dokdonella sp.]